MKKLLKLFPKEAEQQPPHPAVLMIRIKIKAMSKVKAREAAKAVKTLIQKSDEESQDSGTNIKFGLESSDEGDDADSGDSGAGDESDDQRDDEGGDKDSKDDGSQSSVRRNQAITRQVSPAPIQTFL